MKLRLLVLALLVSGLGWSQIAAWDFTGEASQTNSAAEVYNGNLDSSNLITRGAGAGASAGANSFRTVGFQNNGISTANADYFQITLSAATGFTLSLSTIDARFAGTTSFFASPGVSSQFAYSLDGVNFTLINTPLLITGPSVPLFSPQIDLTGIPQLQNVPDATVVTLRYYASGQTTTGGWGFNSNAEPGDYGLAIGGVINSACPAPAIPSGTISGTDPLCGNNILSFSGTAPANVIYYWQTTASGTSMANNADTTLSASASGNYYVRAYNTVDACWSTNSVGPYAVVVTAIPSEPTNSNPPAICAGTPMTITATGDATSYTFWTAASGGVQYTTAGIYTVTATSLSASGSLAQGTYTYYIQGQNGTCVSPTRRAVTLVVNPTPAVPPGSITVSANPSCGPATLTYSAGFYWQTTATGTSTALPTSSNYTLNTTGTVYVRALTGSCWGPALASPLVTIHTPITITTQPANQNRQVGQTAVFSVATTGTVISRQWQFSSDGGSTWSNVVGGTGATTASYTTVAVTEAMYGNLYRCLITNSCGTTESGSGLLTVFVAPPNNGLNLIGCIGHTSIDLSWDAATSGGATGYIVFAMPNATIPQMLQSAAGSAANYVPNSDYSSATEYTTLGRAVYKGSGTTATVTGLIQGNTYTFKVVAYNAEIATGWATGIINNVTPNSHYITYTIGVPNVNITGASTAINSCAITWTNPLPTSCYETLIVANQGPVVFTPTGDGSAYTANPVYSGPNQVVFKGVGIAMTVTGLTQDVEYCYTVFVRRGSEWSTGVSICRTTAAVYCATNVSPSIDDNTGITQVQFNTINQSSSGNPSYTDFTAVSTTVLINQTYNLTVNVDTDGFQTYTKAWIDWNRDGVFNTTTEEYDLGDTYGAATLASNSPLSIYVPANALPGNTRMRIATRYFFDDMLLTPCGTYNYSEVEDYTINIQRPPGAEINVISNNISILSGFDAPFGLNNTLFGPTNLYVENGPRTFTIQNLGLSALNLTGAPFMVTITGDHPGDFTVTQPSTNTIGSAASLDFTVSFEPQIGGIRNAIISIANNDATGSENPYTFAVRGTGVCSTPILSSITPSSGPVGTEVTLTATQNDYVGAVVRYNGVLLTTTQVSPTQIKVIVPAGAITGSFSIVNSTGCTITVPFAIIDTVAESCGGNTADVRAQLFISEVTDHGSGSHTYIELYNPTGGSIPLSGYSVRTHNNGATSATSTINLTGSIAANSTYLIAIGASDASSNFGGHTPNLISTTTQGINNNDHIRLYNGAVWQDLWGNTSNVNFTIAAKDYTYRRLNEGIIAPSTIWNPSDWTAITPVDYTNIGQYANTAGIPPTVDQQPTFEPTCKTVVLEVEASEGVVDATGILYQWFVAIPGQTEWVPLSNGGVYSGANSNVLTISDITGLEGYQYYCQVRENTVTCYVASEAVVIREPETIVWDGFDWTSSITPSFNTNVIFDANYDTSVHGDVTACACQINTGRVVTIASGGYLDIFDGVNNQGTLNIDDTGSLKQHNDDAVNFGNIKMTRTTRNMYRWDYVYWGSPVEENIIAQIPTQFDKKYKWVPGVGANWFILDAVTPGQGFITRVRNIAPFTILAEPDRTISFDFTGKPNNGLVTATMTRVDANALNFSNYNLLGNPYPSAIDAELFLTQNSGAIDGTIYYWTSVTPYPGIGNYSTGDYAKWNMTGGVGTGIGYNADNESPQTPALKPDGQIVAGQGFFVQALVNSATVTFRNAQRLITDNTQFFRMAQPQETQSVLGDKHRFWLNLTSENGHFNQMLVGYLGGATNGIDWGYDGFSVVNNPVNLYSHVNGKSLSIQGRALPFDQNDIVPLGLRITTAGTYKIALDEFDGLFSDDQVIYLEDLSTGAVHNLKQTPYTFTTAAGTFESRFQIRYTNVTLGIDEVTVPSNTVWVYGTDVMTAVSSEELLASVVVHDLLGRRLYEAKNISAMQHVIGLKPAEQVLLVTITLGNGQVETRKVKF